MIGVRLDTLTFRDFPAGLTQQTGDGSCIVHPLMVTPGVRDAWKWDSAVHDMTAVSGLRENN